MDLPVDLTTLSPDQLRALAAQLAVQLADREREVGEKERELQYRQNRIDQLTHELSVIKRQQFGKRSEQLNTEQMSLLDEAVDTDLAAIEAELEQLQPDTPERKSRQQRARRAPLPAHLPRTDIHHDPDTTTCHCGCELERIGEDISEKLDYTPGVFTVERHIRGKWVCRQCETLTQEPVPAHIIDKGIPTAALLAWVLVSKFADHLPLYRLERICARAGLAIPQSTLGDWVGVCGVRLQPLVDALREQILRQGVLHADETPVQMLSPGKGKTHRAYLWAYATTQYASLKAVVYEFADSRAGEHARAFLGDWQGNCWDHARRRYFEIHSITPTDGTQELLEMIGELYSIEAGIRGTSTAERLRVRQEKSKPLLIAFETKIRARLATLSRKSDLAGAINYSLNRWTELMLFCEDGQAEISNILAENALRCVSLVRKNFMFCGSDSGRAGRRDVRSDRDVQAQRNRSACLPRIRLDPYR